VHENVIVKPLSNSEFAEKFRTCRLFLSHVPITYCLETFSAVLLFLFFPSLLSLTYAKNPMCMHLYR